MMRQGTAAVGQRMYGMGLVPTSIVTLVLTNVMYSVKKIQYKMVGSLHPDDTK